MTNDKQSTIVKQRDLLRFTTAGSVDDGKSTLIGRMLFDSKQIFQDQMEQLENTSKLRGEENVNLALLTDGLRAEREQGITIDVAYRYFSTPGRKFIIADTPGHEQYTRNMVTGASTADLAIILIDARHGVLTQSKRHGIIASLLGIPHVVVCVNKMDLVDFSKERFDEIVDEYRQFASKLNIHDISFIPVSALKGDNVVNRSENTPWFQGAPLLQFLEEVTISADRNLVDFRLPVQYVIRPNQDFRGFAGLIASGTVKVGEEIIALPGMQRSTVKSIHAFKDELQEAEEGQAVVITLNDEIDISRGDMIVRRHNIPEIENEFEATVAWMDERHQLVPGQELVLRQTTKTTKAVVDEILYKLDVNSLHRTPADALTLNEIARVRITTANPVCFDPYDRNRATGGFTLIDAADFRTVGAGMIRHSTRSTMQEMRRSSRANIDDKLPDIDAIQWDPGQVALSDRVAQQQHKPLSVWLTGAPRDTILPIAERVEKQLFDSNIRCVRLTDAVTQNGLNADLEPQGTADQAERIRRHAHLNRLLVDAGMVVISAFQDPVIDSAMLHNRIPADKLLVVNLSTDAAGSQTADLIMDLTQQDADTCASTIVTSIRDRL